MKDLRQSQAIGLSELCLKDIALDGKLQSHHNVAGALISSDVDQPLNQPFAIARKEPNSSKQSLLRMTVGKNVERDCLGVFAQAGFLLQLIGGGHAAQAIHLVKHLRA